VGPDLWVANCHTQDRYGRSGERFAHVTHIRTCMFQVAVAAQIIGVGTIHIPKIGCGLGRLDWQEVLYTLIPMENQTGIGFTVHTKDQVWLPLYSSRS